jgi:hypothetical protein
MQVFTVDLSLCNGRYCCQIACKDEHVGNDWSPYAKPLPDTGQFWLGISEYDRDIKTDKDTSLGDIPFALMYVALSRQALANLTDSLSMRHAARLRKRKKEKSCLS